jgi:hypothetical protein
MSTVLLYFQAKNNISRTSKEKKEQMEHQNRDYEEKMWGECCGA